MFDFIPAEYYKLTYYIVMCIMCVCTGFSYMSSKNCDKLLKQNVGYFSFCFALLITLYLGFRPLSGKYFVDMLMYNHTWKIIGTKAVIHFFDIREEWFFWYIMVLCKKAVNDSLFWFLIIDVFYVGCHVWACKKLLKENPWLAILFVCFSSPFFTYGTNGLRNGMAAALMLVSIAYFTDRTTKGNCIGFFIFLLAMGCHRSVMIPMAGLLVSMYIIKDMKKAIYIWLGCIVLSIVAGNSIMHLFMSLGLDERMERYGNNEKMSQFSRTGFRWDFLLYSAVPIYVIWQVAKRGIQDRVFNLIANTYIFANSFWVLVCRIAFSNRFAYLSWFLYGLVIAYAMIRIPIWHDQDQRAGWMLLLCACITMVLGLAM